MQSQERRALSGRRAFARPKTFKKKEDEEEKTDRRREKKKKKKAIFVLSSVASNPHPHSRF